MFRLSVPRNIRREATPLLKLCRRRGQQRLFHDRSEPHGQQRTQSRVETVNSKLPQFLQRYTKPLISAPLTHISAFLILHEVTAVVPILGFAAIFHYTNWLPAYISEWKWVSEGIQKFGNYARKKGWLGNEETRNFRWWEKGEGGLRIVVEFATAYAITKVLLPLRLVLSVWATPWFARFAVTPATKWFKQLFRAKSKSKPPSSGAAGTGATAGGAIPR